MQSFSDAALPSRVVLSGRSVTLLEKFGIDFEDSILQEDIFYVKSLWDKRGFQSYKGHDLFDSLHGGFYSLLLGETPQKQGELFPYGGSRARVIAVEKRYISVFRERPLIWEYLEGPTRVLCIGGYMPLEAGKDNPYVVEFSRFVRNVLSYMEGTSRGTVSFWPITSGGTEERQVSFRLPTLLRVREHPVPVVQVSDNTSGNYSNTSGSRILVNASSNGKVGEIWLHPFRIARALDLLVDNCPIESLIKSFYWSPEKLSFVSEDFTVSVFASVDEPYMIVQFDFHDTSSHDVSLHLESDLQIMWPLDDNYNGRKKYCTQKGRGLVIWTEDEMLSAFVSCDRACEVSAGVENAIIRGCLTTRTGSDNSLAFVIGGSLNAEKISEVIDADDCLQKAAAYYKEYLEGTTQVTTDDQEVNLAIKLAKLGTVKFLVETPGIGKGLMAGFADSRPGWFRARPGYAWYFGRDSEWVSLAMLDWGDFISVRENLDLLLKYQSVEGKIFHELTTSNIVHYDAADSTPLFIYLAWRYAIQSGDIEFVSDNWSRIVLALDYCVSTDTDDDGLIENTIAGHGWVEGGKLYGAHASFYLNSIWKAALIGINDLAGLLGDEQISSRTSELLKKLEKGFNAFFDTKSGQTGLGIDSNRKALDFQTVMTAVGVLLRSVSPQRVLEDVTSYGCSDFSADWGVRVIGKSSGIYNPSGYHEGSIWPLFTGWVSLAEFVAGSPFSAFNHMMANLLDFKHHSKGYVSEVLHGEVYEPSGISQHQAWSESMALHPFFEGLLGISVDAIRNRLDLSPQIPPNFHEIKVQNLKCRKSKIGFSYVREAELNDTIQVRQTYSITSADQMSLSFAPWVPKYASDVSITVDGTPRAFRVTEGIVYKRIDLDNTLLNGTVSICVQYNAPFELYAVKPDPVAGKKSRQPRILSIDRSSEGWTIRLELLPDEQGTIRLDLSEKVEVAGCSCRDGYLLLPAVEENTLLEVLLRKS